MRHLSSFETRAAHAAFETIFPGAGGMVGIGQMDCDGYVRELYAQLPFRAAMGLRAAIWVAALAPLFVIGRWATFAALRTAEREAVLKKLFASSSYLVRQMVMILKTLGALLYAAHPSVRARMLAARRRDAKPGLVPLRLKGSEVAA